MYVHCPPFFIAGMTVEYHAPMKLLKDVAALLACGMSSRFQFEAAARHGLRSGFCLDGLPWITADERAAEIVGAALRKIGAKRPSYQEGQIQYADRDERNEICKSCGKLFEHDGYDHKPRVFCSTLCKWRDQYKRQREGERMSRAEYAAQRAAQSQTLRESFARHCAYCKRWFIPSYGYENYEAAAKAKYCSIDCRNKSYVRTDYPQVECLNCHKVFEQRDKPRKYCSRDCYLEDKKKKVAQL